MTGGTGLNWQEAAGAVGVAACVVAGLQWLFQRGASVGRLHARLEQIERKLDHVIENCPKMKGVECGDRD